MDKVMHQRHLVEQDRDDLGRTLHALAGKVDVQARAKDALSSARMRVRTGARTDMMLAVASSAAALVALISVAVWWRRH
jgi:hypothetical protein